MLDVVASELEALVGRVTGRFGRAEPRRRVREYVSGLVAGLPRSNGWTLAEQAGEVSPDGTQRLLRRADWDIAVSATTSGPMWSSGSVTRAGC